MGQSQRTRFLAGIVIFFAQLFGYFEAGLHIILQKPKKIVALDEIDLAGIDRLRRHFVSFAGDRGAQPQHLPGLGKFYNDRSAARRVDGELDAAFAEHKNAAWQLPFYKQHRPLRIRGRVLDVFKSLERGRRQIAENTIRAQLAGNATFYNLHSIGRQHVTSLL